MSMVSDKEIKEALEIIDEMLEGNEKEKQKGSAHAFRKFPGKTNTLGQILGKKA